MATVIEKLKSELTELTLDGEPDSDIEAAWDAELERRAEMIRQGTATGEPAEQVFAELRNRIFAERKI